MKNQRSRYSSTHQRSGSTRYPRRSRRGGRWLWMLPFWGGLAIGHEVGRKDLLSEWLPGGAPQQTYQLDENTLHKMTVGFSPRGGIHQLLLQRIQQAQKSLYIAMYCFTNAQLADAVIGANQRGVDVWIVTDRSHHRGRGSQIHRLYQAGIPIRIGKAKTMHHKVALIDNEWVVWGSYNWTRAAEHSNAENLTILRNKEIYQSFWEQIKHCFDQGKDYTG